MKIAPVQLVGILTIVALFPAAEKKRNVASEKSAANYPLPEPPVVVNCPPGVSGGRVCGGRAPRAETFNFLIADELSSLYIGRFMFWGLLNFDLPTQTVKPGLAESWTNSPDGKTWTFRLRKNLRWSDGMPLTADDVIFTWNDIIYNPQIPNPLRDEFIIDGKEFTVTKLDDLTVKVVTPEVYAPFLRLSAMTFRFIPSTFWKNTPMEPSHRPTA